MIQNDSLFSKLSENGLIWHSVLVALQYYTQLGFENEGYKDQY